MSIYRKYLFFILFIALGSAIKMAANNYFINWNPGPEKIVVMGEERLCYGFKDAGHNVDAIPEFIKVIKIDNAVRAIKLIDEKTDTLPKEFSGYINKEALTHNFEISFVQGQSSGEKYLSIKVVPLKNDEFSNTTIRLLSFGLEIEYAQNLYPLKSSKSVNYSQNSILGSGNWYKFKVQKTGVYSLTYKEIKQLGFENPEEVGIYGLKGGMSPELNNGQVENDLKEIPVLFWDDGDGKTGNGDKVIFYLAGSTKWTYDKANKKFTHEKHLYSDFAYYFISDKAHGKVISPKNGSTSGVTKNISSFNDFAFHELDTVNLIESGRLWYGEKLSSLQNSHQINFNFPNRISTENVLLESQFVGRSATPSSFDVIVNNSLIENVDIPMSNINEYLSKFAQLGKISKWFLTNGDDLEVEVRYNISGNSSEGYLDFVSANVIRALKLTGNQLSFRSVASVGDGNITKFNIEDVPSGAMVLDVTDFYNVFGIQAAYSGDKLSFVVETDFLKEFVVFDANVDLMSPIIEGDDVGEVINQNIHGKKTPDYLILTHEKFRSQAEDLAEFHRKNSGLDVLVVNQEEVFNEFSSGARDVAAIRNMVKMFYDRSGKTKPRYLLLFGDGSYDNKHMDEYNYNYILTYQSQNSLSPTVSYVSDDYFGLLDDNEDIYGLLDVGIGRFPVKDTLQANIMVNKVKTYMSSETFGDWRNNICFIGDDEEKYSDPNMHMAQADELAENLLDRFPQYNVNKIYLDAYSQVSTAFGARYPSVNNAIYNQIEKGVLLVNYTGHGAEFGLAHERILSNDDINKWKNWGKFPIFMTATCEFSRFDYVDFDPQKNKYVDFVSTGEKVVLHDKGGAVASFTTTRVVYVGPNFRLNQSFYNYVFGQNEIYNERNRLGDIIRLSKIQVGTDINKRNFSLLGDPALTMTYPEHKVVVDSINGTRLAIYEECSELSSSFNYLKLECEKLLKDYAYLDSMCTNFDTLCQERELAFNRSLSICQKADSILPYVDTACFGVDTLGAFKKVTISGHVENENGGRFNDFNGELYMTVFDKKERITTLDNDKRREDNPYSFGLQNNIIFKGKASIENGNYSCSFIVPKDITFTSGNGKISCYATNGEVDASGYDTSIIIGGYDFNTSITDNIGPEIDMYFGNQYFKENGITNESPVLLAYLFDESGINTTTSGLGHEMMAVLDEMYTAPKIMNDFYEAEKDDYQRGLIRFPLLDIEPGEHKIWIKVWDVFNNSSEGEIKFVVEEANRLVLRNVYNYPNPVSDYTSFVIEHNLSGEDIKVEINIYDLTGRLVQTLKNEGQFEGYMTPVVQWNGKGNNGGDVKNGIYFYRVTVESKKGVRELSSKMLIYR